MPGWLVRAALKAPAGAVPWEKNFRVGLADPSEAVAAVRLHLKAFDSLTVVPVSQLSDELLGLLKIGTGEVRTTHGR